MALTRILTSGGRFLCPTRGNGYAKGLARSPVVPTKRAICRSLRCYLGFESGSRLVPDYHPGEAERERCPWLWTRLKAGVTGLG